MKVVTLNCELGEKNTEGFIHSFLFESPLMDTRLYFTLSNVVNKRQSLRFKSEGRNTDSRINQTEQRRKWRKTYFNTGFRKRYSYTSFGIRITRFN